MKSTKILELVNSLPNYFTEEAIKKIKKDIVKNKLLFDDEDKSFLCYKILKNKIHLLWMAVDKNHQNKGIGTELIKQLESLARKIGVKTVEVETLSPNEKYPPYEKTRKFYEQQGFKLIKIKSPKKKGWDEMAIYVKDIK